MSESPNEKIKRLTKGILKKIERNKKNLYDRELSNEDIALVIAQYSAVHTSTISDEDRDRLDDMLVKLDKIHFDVVNMYYWGGKTMQEIGEQYGHGGSSGKKWTSRKLVEAYEIMRLYS